MAGNPYAGSSPLEELYALDNGEEVRFYFSESSLASAIQGGYAKDASSVYKKRPASLQYFGAGGVVDLSIYIDTHLPDRTPSPNHPAFVAFENGGRMDGPREAWDALQKKARKQEAADRRALAKQIIAYRTALQKGGATAPHLPTFD